ncbi:ImmA/IrrE family metallo-endopeptidase [Candidatus Microgenomates bacterium]|nr:MAG: ImmA/IrrE family metallo-endopeptidase [Candidatus Microgenomates bacterium]
MGRSNTLLSTKKNQDALFERGFKSWCENTAVAIRKRLGINSSSPLSPYDLAIKLGVTVWKLEDVTGLGQETREYLTSTQGDEWSAITVLVNGEEIILINPTHSPARQSTDLMHELAHIIRKHDAAQVFLSESGYALRTFNEKQEAEADWFAGTLLLPRSVLEYCTYNHLPLYTILQDYTVSKMLYSCRIRMTGINKQYRKNFKPQQSI